MTNLNAFLSSYISNTAETFISIIDLTSKLNRASEQVEGVIMGIEAVCDSLKLDPDSAERQAFISCVSGLEQFARCATNPDNSAAARKLARESIDCIGFYDWLSYARGKKNANVDKAVSLHNRIVAMTFDKNNEILKKKKGIPFRIHFWYN